MAESKDCVIQVDSRGRTTIPQQYRELFGIDPDEGEKDLVDITIHGVIDENN
ncbi:hypothetical protein [Halorubrum ezzemoulense]|uniref:hypothetical protein n=1 Tax=Halorubrum ezzemoulense TaxID=337243 RepID=UPI00232F56D0|nr:hypothetical protein [Halorubrum ezzemoulense]MDB2243019.1 hypothetical protein [Halorubrum ezzemoulense]